MKIVWKGKFTDMQQLPVGDLPANAVKFKEPETLPELGRAASKFLIPVVIIILFAAYIKIRLGGSVHFPDAFNIWGILLALLMIIPHELLHAIAFPRHAEVQVWHSLRNGMAFVTSTCPMTKARFIFLSLLPNIIFGFLPLLIWILLPAEFSQTAEILLSFATLSLVMGVGDFLNVYNAITQVPNHAMVQLSGFHSYWYLSQN